MIPALPSLTPCEHQARFLQHGEVLHHGEARRGELRTQLAGGPGPLPEEIKQSPPRRIRERLPNRGQIVDSHM